MAHQGNDAYPSWEGKVYFKIKDVMDKYYFTDYEFVSLFESLDNSDSKYILDIIKDSVLNNIKNEDLKQSNEDIVIDNKSLKTVKVSLNINDDLLIRIAKDIINKIENDDKALEILSNNTKISKLLCFFCRFGFYYEWGR